MLSLIGDKSLLNHKIVCNKKLIFISQIFIYVSLNKAMPDFQTAFSDSKSGISNCYAYNSSKIFVLITVSVFVPFSIPFGVRTSIV